MTDAICCNCRYFKNKTGVYGDCLIHDTTVHSGGSGLYCSCFKFKDDFNKDAKDDLKLQVVRVANIRDAKELPYGTLVLKGRNTYLVGKSNELIPVHTEDDIEEREDKPMAKDFLEEHFVNGVEKWDSPEDILNWYRNLYYKEAENTERRIIAEAINDYFMKVKDRNRQIAQAARLDTVLEIESKFMKSIEKLDEDTRIKCKVKQMFEIILESIKEYS